MHEARKALIVLDCGLSLPSAMVRALQYRPYFERSAEWRAEFVSRRSLQLTHLVNRLDKPWIPLVIPLVHRPLVAYTKRWEQKHEDEIVKQAAEFDLIYPVKMPHLRLYQRLRALNGPKVVMDMNDGLWLPAFQAHPWKDLDAILKISHAVICENSNVAEYARRHNQSVFVVPDSPQIEVFDRWRAEVPRDPSKVVLGWIGIPSNAGALYRILDPLEALFAKHPHLHLRVVGAGGDLLPRFESVRWSCRPCYNQEEMVKETLAFDIGLFPMFHNGEGLARGTLKPMIYMSAGAAVLCENYGENPKLIENGVNGLMAATPDEWFQEMDWLVTHTAERKAIAQRGLDIIHRQFRTEQVFARLTSAFDQVLAA